MKTVKITYNRNLNLAISFITIFTCSNTHLTNLYSIHLEENKYWINCLFLEKAV